VDGQGRSASATTLEPTVLLSLDRTTLLDAVHHNAAVADALLRALGNLARRITEQASDLVFLDLAGRVAKCLVHLAVREGHVDGETTVLELPLSQTEIAEMVGGSRQSVNQTMKNFEMRGYCKLRGREVVILDLASLQHRAER
jgi:CRP-like cAMP-binding protein